MSNIFTTLERDTDVSDSKHAYTQRHFLRDMNDPKKKAAFETMKLEASGENVRRLFERADWQEFIPTTMLGEVLQVTQYQSMASQLSNSITIPSGIAFLYRELSGWNRVQRGGENTEFERRKTSKKIQSVELQTLGIRGFCSEEELLDIPLDVMQMELNAMGASMALETDLLFMHALWEATSGTNADDYHNSLTSDAALDPLGLLAVLTWFTSPFDGSTSTITLENPFDTTKESEQVESLMRLGAFRATDVIVSPATYFRILSTDWLLAQHIWRNSTTIDNGLGSLSIPIFGITLHKGNVGHFTDINDPNSWVSTEDIIVLDRNRNPITQGVRQPLQVRNWSEPRFRTEDFQLLTRFAFASMNKRALCRVANSDPYLGT